MALSTYSRRHGGAQMQMQVSRESTSLELLDNNNPQVQDEDLFLNLGLQADVYDAVVVASFGGLAAKVPRGLVKKSSAVQDQSSDEDKTRMRWHPLAALLFLSIPLYKLQMTLLMCLALDIDMSDMDVESSAPVRDPASEGESVDWNDESDRLMVLARTLMMILFGLFITSEFIYCMKPLVVVLNPYTWMELHRPHSPGWAGTSGAVLCASACIIAKIMQLHATSTLWTFSMSIMLSTPSLTDVIFNGLAIVFIAELDERLFQFGELVLLFDVGTYGAMCQGIAAARDATYPDPDVFHARFSWIGGRAMPLVYVIQNCFILFQFTRTVLYWKVSIDTGVLPIARDFCLLWEGARGQAFTARFWLQEMRLGTLFNVERLLMQKMESGEGALGQQDASGRIPCLTDKLAALQVSDLSDLDWSLRGHLLPTFLVLSFVLVMYPFLLFNQRTLVATLFPRGLDL